MPVVSKGNLQLDYADDGQGPPVVLIHSSVSGNRQWGSLTAMLRDNHRVLAINLFGYGETTPWPAGSEQTLYAQAQLVAALCDELEGPVRLVGHSFGGSVALKAAVLLGPRVERMVLLEPNPFYLLRQCGRIAAYLEARALRDHVKCFGSLEDWAEVAARFADYWAGDGAWNAMPDKRRNAFARALIPNFHEWDAVMEEETTVDDIAGISCPTLVLSDPRTRRPIREIVEVLAASCPHWSFGSIADGGHMAPLTRPDLVDPTVAAFLATPPD
ncbi:MAG: 2-hydroxy-6-oxo-6-(2-aminophenyl)hexa-2, 4-dienoic acid hydrolase [Acidimicrobiales bacterium]|nr:2-hydroxy-6-oxo-6-(2-aminophenyl)hexa-2, 4-dienoic acid hydrolase [Acidimicrobiales bacterium]